MDNPAHHQITHTKALTLLAPLYNPEVQLEQRNQAIALGRRLLERALQRLAPGDIRIYFSASLPLLAVGDGRSMDRILQDIGMGRSLAILVAEQLVSQQD